MLGKMRAEVPQVVPIQLRAHVPPHMSLPPLPQVRRAAVAKRAKKESNLCFDSSRFVSLLITRHS